VGSGNGEQVSYLWHSKVKKLGECHKFSNFTSDKVMTPKFGLGGGGRTCVFMLLCCFGGYVPTSDDVMTPTQLTTITTLMVASSSTSQYTSKTALPPLACKVPMYISHEVYMYQIHMLMIWLGP
jgi:hypothetical protein